MIPFKNIKKCAVAYKWITIIKEIIGAASESLHENNRARFVDAALYQIEYVYGSKLL